MSSQSLNRISKYLEWARHTPDCAFNSNLDEICDCGLLELRSESEDKRVQATLDAAAVHLPDNLQRGEISYNETWLAHVEDTAKRDDWHLKLVGSDIRMLCRLIRRYQEFDLIKPVSVSRCANAVAEMSSADRCYSYEVAKVVLDAAGVKYVD